MSGCKFGRGFQRPEAPRPDICHQPAGCSPVAPHPFLRAVSETGSVVDQGLATAGRSTPAAERRAVRGFLPGASSAQRRAVVQRRFSSCGRGAGQLPQCLNRLPSQVLPPQRHPFLEFAATGEARTHPKRGRV